MAAGLVLVCLLVGLLLWQRPWQSDESVRQAPAFPTDAPAQLASRSTTLTAADSASALADAFGESDAAREWGANVFEAQQELGVSGVSWRYVTGGEAPSFDNGDGRATFELRVAGTDETLVDLRLRPTESGNLDLVGVVSADDPMPVWLAPDVSISETGRIRVVAVGGDDQFAISESAQRGLDQVRELLPDVSDELNVVVPATEELTAAIMGRPVDDITQIAAVAMLRDGRDGELEGPTIVLNPTRFTAMDERAAQIVVTHEVTHVLTESLGTSVDTWVAEGFADFIALHDDTASLETSAGQILQQVSREGPPDALPTSEEFGSGPALGAVYESAWLAMRMLAEQYGDAAVIEFYDDAIAGATTADAAESAFGVSIDQITQDWRDDLIAKAANLD